MYPFALIATTRDEGRDWIAEHFPDTSGWFQVVTPRSDYRGELFLAAYATPEALERRAELRIGRLFKAIEQLVREGVAASPERVV